MTVSDPHLKQLKTFVLQLRTEEEDKITDRHGILQFLCETLEFILKKGLMKDEGSFFSGPKSYWMLFEDLYKLKSVFLDITTSTQRYDIPENFSLTSPRFDLAFDGSKTNKRTSSYQSKCRLLLRSLLQCNNLSWPIDFLRHLPQLYRKFENQLNHKHRSICKRVLTELYSNAYSILGNEILLEIFFSLLKELDKVTFKLDLCNCSFLDESWTMPILIHEEFVPCRSLGLELYVVGDFLIVDKVEMYSVAGEDEKVVAGDILYELCGFNLKGSFPNLREILRENGQKPVLAKIIKCLMPAPAARRTIDSNNHNYNVVIDEPDCGLSVIYPPLVYYLKKHKREDLLHRCYQHLSNKLATSDNSLESVNMMDRLSLRSSSTLPYFNICKAFPTNNFNENIDKLSNQQREVTQSSASVYFVGKCFIGNDGGVHKIEGGIGRVLSQVSDPDATYELVSLSLGEKDVIIRSYTDENNKSAPSNDAIVLWTHTYPQISSCGRRVDCTQFFAYIVGESTCTISKEFECYVFQARNNDESKLLLCGIAKGFERTHWAI